MAVSEYGDTYGCGNNSDACLGLPGIEFALNFSKIHSCEGGNVAKVFAGGHHSFIVLDLVNPKKEPETQIEENLLTEINQEVEADIETDLLLQVNYTDT